MKTLTKPHLALTYFTAKDQTRPVLTGVHVESDTGLACAADGFKLLVMPLAELPDGDYPETPGAGTEPIREGIIPAAAVVDAVKSLPKHNNALPALDHVKLSGGGNGKVVLTTTSLDTVRDARTPLVTGTFPTYGQLIPAHISTKEAGRAKVTTIGLEHLEAIVKAAKAIGSDKVRLQVTDWEAPVRFEMLASSEQRGHYETLAYGVIMPMFIED